MLRASLPVMLRASLPVILEIDDVLWPACAMPQEPKIAKPTASTRYESAALSTSLMFVFLQRFLLLVGKISDPPNIAPLLVVLVRLVVF
jgi:hypothetical protein